MIFLPNPRPIIYLTETYVSPLLPAKPQELGHLGAWDDILVLLKSAGVLPLASSPSSLPHALVGVGNNLDETVGRMQSQYK